MLLVDDRMGSKHLVSYLGAILGKENVALEHLAFGDIAWAGKADTKWVKCGVEIKSVDEIVGEFANPRFIGHQLPGMLKAYDWNWLLVQGMYRPNPKTGLMEKKAGKEWKPLRPITKYGAFWTLLNTIDLKAGIRVHQSDGVTKTAHWLAAMYRWWQSGWDHHSSHQRIYTRPPKVTIKEPTTLMRIAAQLPGIGWDRAEAVDTHFKAVGALLRASEEDWRAVPGIGKKTAQRAVELLTGGIGNNA